MVALMVMWVGADAGRIIDWKGGEVPAVDHLEGGNGVDIYEFGA